MDLITYLDSTCADNCVIIIGDFNCSDICWSTLTGSSSFPKDLCNLAFKHNLVQLVDFPPHSSGSTLDLIFSSPGVHVRDLNKFNHYIFFAQTIVQFHYLYLKFITNTGILHLLTLFHPQYLYINIKRLTLRKCHL